MYSEFFYPIWNRRYAGPKARQDLGRLFNIPEKSWDKAVIAFPWFAESEYVPRVYLFRLEQAL
jgi:hypothetical protein